MRVWKIAGGSVAVLGAAALVVAASADVRAQQKTYTFKTPDNAQEERRIIVRDGGPLSVMAGVAGQDVRLGVAVREVKAEDVTRLKLAGASGVIVEEVQADTPAAKGGVLKGDVALVFDGESVRSVAQFTRLVRETAPGRAVKMTVLREAKRVELTVAPDATAPGDTGLETIIERKMEAVPRERSWDLRVLPRGGHPGMNMMPFEAMPDFRWEGEPGADVFAFSSGRGRLGVSVQDVSGELGEFFGVKEGALVSTVQADTPAAKAGIKAGDVITAIDGKAVTSASDLVAQLKEKSGEVSITVTRDRKPVTLKATLQKPEAPKRRMIIQGDPA